MISGCQNTCWRHQSSSHKCPSQATCQRLCNFWQFTWRFETFEAFLHLKWRSSLLLDIFLRLLFNLDTNHNWHVRRFGVRVKHYDGVHAKTLELWGNLRLIPPYYGIKWRTSFGKTFSRWRFTLSTTWCGNYPIFVSWASASASAIMPEALPIFDVSIIHSLIYSSPYNHHALFATYVSFFLIVVSLELLYYHSDITSPHRLRVLPSSWLGLCHFHISTSAHHWDILTPSMTVNWIFDHFSCEYLKIFFNQPPYETPMSIFPHHVVINKTYLFPSQNLMLSIIFLNDPVVDTLPSVTPLI